MKSEKEISILLKKYYEGETSPEEEAELKYFYLNNNKSNAENAIFKAFSEFQNESLYQDFDNRILKSIKVRKTNYNYYLKIISIAAVFLILALPAYWFYYISSPPKAQSGLVITDENYLQNKEKADKELEKAFSLVSKNMNIAKKEISKLDNIDKSFEKIKKLQLFKKSNKHNEV